MFKMRRRFLFVQFLPYSGQRSTNTFRKDLPDIFESSTYFKKAFQEVSKLKPNPKISNKLVQQRKYSITYLNDLMVNLSRPLTHILKSYHQCFTHLHPFEATVAELTIIARKKQGYKDLKEILTNLKSFRALTSQIAKTFIFRLKETSTQLETKVVLAQAQISLARLYNYSTAKLSLSSEILGSMSNNIAPPEFPQIEGNHHPPHVVFSELLDLHLSLRRIPEIEFLVPTLVLVGAPNVGKSSIVRAISSGTPEVANYPFTTRGLSVGHILTNDWRIQVMDSPGLLDRPSEERNEMERLTYASLAHLPSAVIFVLDPTGLAGDKSTVAAQLNIRKSLRERFPKRPWIDVCSKSDLPLENSPLLEDISKNLSEFLMVSSQTGRGIDQLKGEIIRVAQELSPKLQEMKEAMANTDHNNSRRGGDKNTSRGEQNETNSSTRVKITL